MEKEGKMKKYPKEIYLQHQPEDEEYYRKYGTTFESTTWCVDKINDTDIKYIRADLVGEEAK